MNEMLHQPKLLCFNLKDKTLQNLRCAAQEHGASVQVIAPAEFSQTIGALLGILPRSNTVCLTPFREPMLIMSSFDREKMEAFLGTLKEKGVSIPYKAVVTPTNLLWQCDALAAELKKEHEQFRRMQQKND